MIIFVKSNKNVMKNLTVPTNFKGLVKEKLRSLNIETDSQVGRP